MSDELALVIQRVDFRPDGIVEISYSEGHDQGEHVAMVRILLVEANQFEPQVTGLLEDVTELIDLAVNKLRNPPMTRPSRAK